MGTVAEVLLRDALSLDAAERADLAAALLDSLEAEPAASSNSAWLLEVERRAQRALAGEPGIPWQERRAELAASLKR